MQLEKTCPNCDMYLIWSVYLYKQIATRTYTIVHDAIFLQPRPYYVAAMLEPHAHGSDSVKITHSTLVTYYSVQLWLLEFPNSDPRKKRPLTALGSLLLLSSWSRKNADLSTLPWRMFCTWVASEVDNLLGLQGHQHAT